MLPGTIQFTMNFGSYEHCRQMAVPAGQCVGAPEVFSQIRTTQRTYILASSGIRTHELIFKPQKTVRVIGRAVGVIGLISLSRGILFMRISYNHSAINKQVNFWQCYQPVKCATSLTILTSVFTLCYAIRLCVCPSANHYLLTYGAEPFLRSFQLCSYPRTSQHFIEPEGSSPCSKEPSTGPYPDPDRSSTYHPILSLSDLF
jgi:hypothetical protein